jgi:hypothetical protein
VVSFAPSRFALGESAPGNYLLGVFCVPEPIWVFVKKEIKLSQKLEVEKRLISRPEICLITVLNNIFHVVAGIQ